MTEDLDTIVDILSREDAKVVFFVGAGISTNCGIPDFRSPKTGLYSNLQRLNLPYPEAVFDIDYFRKNPKAFYTLAEEMMPEKFLPSRFHYFIKLCQDKHILKRCYTQNIDTLERVAGLQDDYVVEAHGSFAKNHCIECHAEMSTPVFRALMKKGVPKCPVCKGLVKPDIVFFGESLPRKFFKSWDSDMEDDYDLAIVAGTSLKVYPFASLPQEVSEDVPRVLINRELCGDFEDSPRDDDIVFLQDCDSLMEQLARRLGWENDLEALIAEGRKKLNASNGVGEVKTEVKETAEANEANEATKPVKEEPAKEEEAAAAAKKPAKELAEKPTKEEPINNPIKVSPEQAKEIIKDTPEEALAKQENSETAEAAYNNEIAEALAKKLAAKIAKAENDAKSEPDELDDLAADVSHISIGKKK